jgi:hypothetical protein
MNIVPNYLEQPEGWNQGIYDLESYAQYDSIQALRSSQLKLMRKSAAHFRASFEYKKPISAQLQKSFDKGKAFDVLILHGREAMDQLVAIDPGYHRNSNKYKDWAEINADKVFLTAEEYRGIVAMAEAAFKKERFSEIFNGPGYRHKVIVWKDVSTGIWCKAEIDFIREGTPGAVVDLKSTADAGFWFFSKNARRLGYANQGAHYLDGLTQVTGLVHTEFYLSAVETLPPFESHVFKVSRDMIDRAQLYNEENMQTLVYCLTNDIWPGYPDQIMDLESGHYFDEEYLTEEEMEEFDDASNF